MATPAYYYLPTLPPGLEDLSDLALDLRWTWNHAADRLWKTIDAELWERTGNPWLILQTISISRLESLARDQSFHQLLEKVSTDYREAMEKPAWFAQTHPLVPLRVAYFCMEFGLSETLPIYSGGLGMLAGDYLKTASDLGVPVIGIGLLYQQGYFRQAIDSQGDQLEYFPYNNPGQLPIVPVRIPNGEWLRVPLDLPGRQLILRVWEAHAGPVRLFLLDSNDPYNSPADRGITSELYGGGPEMRLQQEMVLGIGGWRALEALGIEPSICHINEGHAALAVMERAQSFMKSSGQSFDTALTATRTGNIFTTHTPVEAGFDRFSPGLVSRYLGHYVVGMGIDMIHFLSLGRQNPADKKESFNMAYLAFRGSGAINAVSDLHSKVSRRIFQSLFPRWPQPEVPITYVTNGVHMPSWDSEVADKLWTKACGKERWLGTMETIKEDLQKVPSATLWKFRNDQTQRLISYARQRLAQQLEATGATSKEVAQSYQVLSPEILTLGFARRFTAYKRPNLLLHDKDRLIQLLNDPNHPVQVIIAGKAHPQDTEGKALIRDWIQFIRSSEIRRRIIFLADYDIALAKELVQGVDVWINTPRRPWEACGTSGMKILVNGGLNLSERDGWWTEAYRPEVGWAIGDGLEHDSDPHWDALEAEQLYTILEKELVPKFYERDEQGIPQSWITLMRNSMAELTPHYSTNRMLREYVEKLYLPALQEYTHRVDQKGQEALNICNYQDTLRQYWSQLRFGRLEIQSGPEYHDFRLPVYPGKLDLDLVSVQMFAEPQDDIRPEIHRMTKTQSLEEADKVCFFQARIANLRPVRDYTPRIVPAYPGLIVPLEANQILWYELRR